jgi:two-component system chemotaxis response regulator CheB
MDSASALKPPAAALPVQVMVVDDSAVVRGLVSRRIDMEPDMQVCCSAANGAMALVELQRHAVDVIILDIEMPIMDGMTALPKLLAQKPGVKVLIASSLSRRNAEISLKALHLGAADYLGKPDANLSTEDFNRELVAKVRAIAPRAARPLSPAPMTAVPSEPVRLVQASGKPVQAIAIGGSTGAPPLLIKLFERLSPTMRQPIFVTQHMPATFTTILAEQIGRAAGRPCAEAVNGQPVEAGKIYVAPGGWHMTVARQGVQVVTRLDQGPQENFCRPAVDPMLRGLAEVYGNGLLAVILTGMGCDGAKGCEAVAKVGGRFVVQDEATSVVWGMPGAAARTGLAERVLAFDAIAPFLNQTIGVGL